MNMHRDRGFTLVEVLVAVVILGIAATGIIPAVRALVLSSQDHRGLASADAVLRTYGEAVALRAQTQDVLCPTLADVRPSAAQFTAVGWNFSETGVSNGFASTQPDYWLPATDFRTGTWGNRAACLSYAATTCPSYSPIPAECDGGLIRIRITATSTTTSPTHATPSAVTEVLIRRGHT